MKLHNILCRRIAGENHAATLELGRNFWLILQDSLRGTGMRLVDPPHLPPLVAKLPHAGQPLDKEKSFVPSFFNLQAIGESPEDILRHLREHALMKAASLEAMCPNQSIQFHADPNDDEFSHQKPYFDRMQIVNAWTKVTTPPRNRIAVALVDSGVFEDHADFTPPVRWEITTIQSPFGGAISFPIPTPIAGLSGSLEQHQGCGMNFPGVSRHCPSGMNRDIADPYGHGTMMAGVLGATINNGMGIAGMLGAAQDADETKCLGPKADLVITRVGFNDYKFLDQAFAALEYLNWLIQTGVPIKVVLLAWGVFDPDPAAIALMKQCLQLPYLARTLVVTSAGKSDSDLGPGERQLPVYPALFGGNKTDAQYGSLPNVVCVGSSMVASSDKMDIRASGSPYSTLDQQGESYIDIFAPGETIQTLGRAYIQEYRVGSGTSFAAAHVAGVAALLFSENRDATAAEVKDRLIKHSDPPGSPATNDKNDIRRICVAGLEGGGILNADRALDNWPVR